MLGVLVLLASVSSPGPELILAQRERPSDCTVALPANAGVCLRYAAEELTNYVAQSTGVILPIVQNGCAVGTGRIILRTGRAAGLANAPPDSPLPLPDGSDGFRLRAANGCLVIESPTERGCLYGVYEMLERYAGVRWYASWRTNVPSRVSIAVPDGLDDVRIPAFKMRKTSWHDMSEHPDFAAHLRFNDPRPTAEAERFGGTSLRFAKGTWSCHTLGHLLSTNLFGAHPDYFAEVNGKRTTRQPCLSHPDVLAIVTSNVLEKVRSDLSAQFVGVSQNDNQDYCRCARCAAVDAEEGSHAGTVVRFVNAIAEEVEKIAPAMKVETLAYQWSTTPTKKTRLRHNVVPYLCTSQCGFARPMLENRKCQGFLRQLDGWSSQTAEVMIWDYLVNFTEYYMPWANIRTMQGNCRLFRDRRVKYYFGQAARQSPHTDLAELKTWLLAKWLWNPDQSLEELLDDFLPGYYGAGAPFVREYLKALHEDTVAAYDKTRYRMHLYVNLCVSEQTDEMLSRWRTYWDRAEAATANDAAASYAVRMGSFGIDYARLERARRKNGKSKDKFLLPRGSWAATAKSLLDRVTEMGGKVRFREGKGTEEILNAWRLIVAGTYDGDPNPGKTNSAFRLPTNAVLVHGQGGYNSWPMIQTVGNRLVCCYSRGSAHTIDEGRRNAYARFSEDGGRTWGPEVTVAADPTVGECAEGAGTDSRGNGLFWIRRWGRTECRGHDLYRTSDGTNFIRIASLSSNPMPMQVTDPVCVDGMGLVSPWFAGSYQKNGSNSWGILVSADEGLTWEQRIVDSGMSVREWVTEPSLVDLGGGRLLIVGRGERGSGSLFQVVSSDYGKNWKKFHTNIGDVLESTPSLLFDRKSGMLTLYYYHRGARQMKRRVAAAATVFDNPMSWPAFEVVAGGFETRTFDAGNVNSTRCGKSDCCAWYTGTPTRAAVVVTIVPSVTD